MAIEVMVSVWYHTRSDIDTIERLWADDATWTTPGESSVAGTARGKEAVLAQYGRYGGETNGTFEAPLLAVFGADDGRVVGLHHNVAERDGKKLVRPSIALARVERQVAALRADIDGYRVAQEHLAASLERRMDDLEQTNRPRCQ